MTWLLEAAPSAAPTDLGELRDAVRDLPGPVLLAGAGTAAGWAGTPSPAHVVSTGALRGVITHNPGDMTVSVRAGTPLVELQEELRDHGQRVAVDPARARRGATIGGLFATGDSGPLAMSFGSLRDLVIGATVVLADGTIARTGGHVIKNVAGYDLAKLLHGAHGTLAAVAEFVLRLFPEPQGVRTVALDVPIDGLADAVRRAIAGQVEVTALEWTAPSVRGGGRLLGRLEGTPEGVAGRARRLVDEIGGGARELAPDEADSAWAAHAEAVDASGDDVAVLRIGVLPSRLVDLLVELDTATGGLRQVTSCPATGVATFGVEPDGPVVQAVHERVAAAGGTSTLRRRPADADLPAWGPPPSSTPLLRAVATSLDPDQRLGRGRLAPWLPLPTGAPA